MKSTAKSAAWMRDLKDKLVLRGLSVVESLDNGWSELTINTDQAYIKIEAVDAVSKNILGMDLKAATPHELVFAIDEAINLVVLSKLYVEISKLGIAILFKSGATLALAKAAVGEEIMYDVRFPTKGM